jgi:hypothetical protein
VALLVLYLATLAPDVTFWDAGEFIAAARTLGIPHPPGTPLYVLLLRAWSLALPLLPTAAATNLFSAVCTAAAGALGAGLVARWTGRPLMGLAAALCAGCLTTVWSSATETEVYAPALLLAVITLWTADRCGWPAGMAGPTGAIAAAERPGGRRVALIAYLFALSVPLHLSGLVAAPAAIALAGTAPDRRPDRRTIAVLSGAFLTVMGLGTLRPAPLVAGAALLIATALSRRRTRVAIGVAGAVLLGVSVVAVLLLRARHDPAINQGNPDSMARLLAVVARRQYDLAPLWPRQAPLWLQAGNLFQYADWQAALGLAPEPPFSAARTGVTAAFAMLGLLGCLTHRRLDRRSWRALSLLALSASAGVLLYLNLKAGPSIGYGLLPDAAPHEARERDYFFGLAFWCWGLWAGIGAVRLVTWRPEGVRHGAGAVAAALAISLAPAALNWRVMDRRREPDASLPHVLAEGILRSAPPAAVLFVAGDNDTYPLWYAQQVRGLRRDVTVVTIPLLGASWYRDELARRYRLIAAPPDATPAERAVMALANSAARLGRPVAVSVTAVKSEASVLTASGRWVERGLVLVAAPDSGAPPPPLYWPVAWRDASVGPRTDLTTQGMLLYLRCRLHPGPGAQPGRLKAALDSECNPK